MWRLATPLIFFEAGNLAWLSEMPGGALRNYQSPI